MSFSEVIGNINSFLSILFKISKLLSIFLKELLGLTTNLPSLKNICQYPEQKLSNILQSSIIFFALLI